MSAALDLFGLFPELPAGDQHQDSDADRRILARLGPGPIERFARTGRINWSATLASRPDQPCEVCKTPTPVRFIRHRNLAKTCGSASCRAILTDPAARGAKGNAARKAQREALNDGTGPMCKVCRALPAVRDRTNGAWNYCRKPGSGKRTTACTRRAMSAFRSGFTMDHAGYVAALAARRAAQRAAREQREAKREAREQREAKRAQEAAVHVRPRAGQTRPEATCAACGLPFVPDHSLTRHCSRATCVSDRMRRIKRESKRRRRHRLKAMAANVPFDPRVTIAALRARDGDRCNAVKSNGTKCGCRLRFTGDPNHPRAVTLGHIDARMKNGAHVFSNCRLECREVNSLMREHSQGEQILPLFGGIVNSE